MPAKIISVIGVKWGELLSIGERIDGTGLKAGRAGEKVRST